MIDAEYGESLPAALRVRPVSRRKWRWAWIAGLYAAMAWGQAPVEKATQTPDAVLDAQQKAGMAYSEWQEAMAARAKAQENAKKAALDFQNTQQELNASKQRAEKAQQLFEIAKTQETAARAAYRKATGIVNRAWGRPLQSKQ